jgi:CRISPR-associated protein Csy3
MANVPSVLAFRRTISPGHVLMYSAPRKDFDENELQPVLVREEPLRGLNATSRTEEAKKGEAVLQVVESAELRPGHEVLVLRTRLAVRPGFETPAACNDPEFTDKHRRTVADIIARGGATELGRRYALTLASADWAWRNSLEAESVTVRVRWRDETMQFEDLILDDTNPFDFGNPAYRAHLPALKKLARLLKEMLMSTDRRAPALRIEAVLQMGPGARVYPSQEWASAHAKEESKRRWPGGDGITRVLAKLPLPDGAYQAIINDRKAGNRLRRVDTWHGRHGIGAIAVEPYGANAHAALVLRGTGNSAFDLYRKVANDEVLSDDEGLYYLAVCIRGGVYGVKE